MAVFLSSQQFEWYKVIIPALNTVNKTREYVFFFDSTDVKKEGCSAFDTRYSSLVI